MELEIISYHDLLDLTNCMVGAKVKNALFETGILGVRQVPQFEEKSAAFIRAARGNFPHSQKL